jgi:predicted permease
MSSGVRPVLLMLLSGAALLSLIAYINVLSLFLARSDSRVNEIAVRHALGASSARITKQFAGEAIVLVVVSTAVASVLAAWSTSFLSGLLTADMLNRMPYLGAVGMNVRVASYAAALSLLAAALFTLAPFTRVSRSTGRSALHEGTRGSTASTWRRFGGSLVVAELAFAVILLVSAGLISKSLYRLLHVDLGFTAEQLITFSVSPTAAAQTGEPPNVAARLVADRVAALPGVLAVGYADLLPLGRGLAPSSGFQVVGQSANVLVEDHPVRRISAGFFEALQATVLRGRLFTEAEVASAGRVVIINETAARRYFPGENPIGRHVIIGAPPPAEIVGVVSDIKDGPPESRSYPAAYLPFDQTAFGLVVRTSGEQQTLTPAVLAAIREVRPDLLIQGGRTVTEQLNTSPSTSQQRASAWLVGGFAITALLLSVIGLYGVVSYAVEQRTREIGVRMALGAPRRRIYQLIVRDAASFVVVGVGIGIVGAATAANLMRGLLFGVEPWDTPTLAGAASLLIASALFAAYVPARRAARVDPLVALRYE